MFTGLIEEVGSVREVEAGDGARALRVACSFWAGLDTGASVALNGVCLTVTECREGAFGVVVSPETLRVTTLGELRAGSRVNLERPLRADARLGGHFVQGHVDGVGRVASLEPDGACWQLDVDVPPPLRPHVVHKGSIACDGISLTVASERNGRVGIQIVPHTYAHTTLGDRRAGDRLNIETDVLGKYVARLLAGRAGPEERGGVR
jgi:riboflavin synthase